MSQCDGPFQNIHCIVMTLLIAIGVLRVRTKVCIFIEDIVVDLNRQRTNVISQNGRKITPTETESVISKRTEVDPDR